MYISQADSYSYYYQSTSNSTSNTTKSAKTSSEDFFSAVDTSKDGSVDQSELSILMSNLEAETGQSINVEEQFSEYDADGDGTYTSEELQSFMDANRPEPSEDMAELEGSDDTAEMMGPGGPPPPPPSSGSTEEDDDDTLTIDELFSSLENDETSSTNTYLALLNSLQSELFSSGSDEDDDDSETTVADYLNNLNQSLAEDADYTSISIEA